MQRDDLTMELPGVPKKRGRPKTGKAMTGAERMRKLRARRTAEALAISVTRDENESDIACAAQSSIAAPIESVTAIL